MATYAEQFPQALSEIHTYTVDFTDDLPQGGTVTGGTATHTPPSGSASTIAVSVASPYVYATLPAQTVPGVHFLDVLATFNDGDKSAVRIPVNVVYPAATARSGMAALIQELRGMAEASPGDYRVAGVPYWTDAQLQDVLDNHRVDVVFEQLAMVPTRGAGGALVYQDYRSNYGFFEQTTGGTAVFFVQDSAGTVVSSGDYTPDYRRGQIQFGADQAGAIRYLTARSYDLDAAAAEIWRRKASHYASSFDFSTDNHSVQRSQVYQHCLEMARHFEGKSATAVEVVPLRRGDME